MTMLCVTHEMGFARQVAEPRHLHGRRARSSRRTSRRNSSRNPQHERTKLFPSSRARRAIPLMRKQRADPSPVCLVPSDDGIDSKAPSLAPIASSPSPECRASALRLSLPTGRSAGAPFGPRAVVERGAACRARRGRARASTAETPEPQLVTPACRDRRRPFERGARCARGERAGRSRPARWRAR